MSDNPAGDVAAYYEGNTRRFMRWGEGGSAGALHRALWGPGAETVADAADYINVLCAQALRPGLANEQPHVADLGCGVGATAVRLAEILGARSSGLTLSRLQADLASERARDRGLGDRCSFYCADFLEPPALSPLDGAVAIEAFAHASDAAHFFEVAADLLSPGARLVVVDDFENPADKGFSRRDKTVERFRRGWRLHSLVTRQRAAQFAEGAGLVLEDERDLTDWIRLGRPRDRAIAAAVALLGWARPLERFPYWSSLVGGDALQTCLRNRWVEYRLLAWRRP